MFDDVFGERVVRRDLEDTEGGKVRPECLYDRDIYVLRGKSGRHVEDLEVFQWVHLSDDMRCQREVFWEFGSDYIVAYVGALWVTIDDNCVKFFETLENLQSRFWVGFRVAAEAELAQVLELS